MIVLWLRTWQLGIKSLLLHPMRSLLTVLGIFIGVASVIWLLAIGEGISAKAQEQIASLGAENIIVRSIQPADGGTDSVVNRTVAYGLTRDDFARLRIIPTVEQAIPIREITMQFRNGSRMISGRLVGCTPEYADVIKLQMDRGHFVSAPEQASVKNHCVLSAEVASGLFPAENPIGQAVHADNEIYLVVGVTRPRAPSSAIGGSLAAQDFSKDIYIPINTFWQRIGDMPFIISGGTSESVYLEISQVTLRVSDVRNVLDVAQVVERSLDMYHKNKDYGITVPLELLEQARTTKLMFMTFMGLIAAISLLVGGIGIMNIMLATVTERTREIGIRRAIGARRRDITQQFLIETIVLSVVGGVTGILAGLTCGPVVGIVRGILERSMPEAMANLPEVVRSVTPQVVPWSIPLAFGISVGVGVLFGIYPAIRAASMDPIEALRHE